MRSATDRIWAIIIHSGRALQIRSKFLLLHNPEARKSNSRQRRSILRALDSTGSTKSTVRSGPHASIAIPIRVLLTILLSAYWLFVTGSKAQGSDADARIATWKFARVSGYERPLIIFPMELGNGRGIGKPAERVGAGHCDVGPDLTKARSRHANVRYCWRMGFDRTRCDRAEQFHGAAQRC